MSEKNTNEKKTNSVPASVIIADTRNKLIEIANCSLLPPSILELIFKEVWQTVAIKAQSQLVTDYEKYQEQEKDTVSKEKEDESNGL